MTARRIGLVEASDDGALLAFPLWPKQRELLAGVDADNAPRLHLWALGRRASKTSMCALAAVHNCCLRPDLDALVRRGEVRNAVVVATNQQQGRVLLGMAKGIVEASPLLRGLVSRETEDALCFELPSGARSAIRLFPCSSRAIRGFAVSLGVMDESAHFTSEGEVGNAATADRVFTALQPATAQFGGLARLMLISTPFGDQGLFAELFHRAVGGEVPDAVAVHAPSAEVNPTLSADMWAQEEARRAAAPRGRAPAGTRACRSGRRRGGPRATPRRPGSAYRSSIRRMELRQSWNDSTRWPAAAARSRGHGAGRLSSWACRLRFQRPR
jgi:hypothetical protein